jgi:hypothetical protein
VIDFVCASGYEPGGRTFESCRAHHKINRVLRFCRDEMLRIAVSGYDPLIPPAEAKPLPRVKEIKVTASADSDDEYDFTHDWSLRRIRRPII